MQATTMDSRTDDPDEKMFDIESFGFVARHGSFQTYVPIKWEKEKPTKNVAVKLLGISSETFDADSSKEIQMLISLNHVNVVKFLGYCKFDPQIALVMELCNSDLRMLINSQKTFSEHEVAFFVNQVCQGLSYLHVNDVIHKNIKPGNILIMSSKETDVQNLSNVKEMVLKISDIGVSKHLREIATAATMTEDLGFVHSPWEDTLLYMAPELRDDDNTRNAHYSMMADVYSVGLVAYNLSRKDLSSLKAGTKGLGATVLEQESQKPMLFYRFLSACLQYQADKRNTSSKLLEHPFFGIFDIERFNATGFLGRGRFGDVFKYSRLSSEIEEGDQDVAVKKLGISAESFDVKSCREIQTMTSLNHVNVVRYFGYCNVDFLIGLVIELCKCDVDKLIRSQKTFTEGEVAFLINQVCQGLAYLHQNGIIHRDIKPENILVTSSNELDILTLPNVKEMVLKISDFGLARLLEAGVTSATMTVVGTLLYMAPELRDALGSDGVHYSTRADVYSVGLVAYNLLRKDLQKLKAGSEGIGTTVLEREVENPTLLNSFLYLCLQYQPDKRDTSANLLKHPFFEEVLFEDISKASLWAKGDACTAIHYSKPSNIIIGTKEGKLIIYDMRAMTINVKKLNELPILSIHSNDSFIAVGSSDVRFPVTILRKKDNEIVKMMTSHTSLVRCVQMTNDYLVTVGDDEKMFVFSLLSWDKVAEMPRVGFARHQCVAIKGNILTAIDNRRVKQYKLDNQNCKEIFQLKFTEQLYSIVTDITDHNICWIGTSLGTLHKVNINEKEVLVSEAIKEGKQIFQIKFLKDTIVCLLKDPITGELGPVAAYNNIGLLEIVDRKDVFGPLESTGEWLVYSNGRKLKSINTEIVIRNKRKVFINISGFRTKENVTVIHFTDPKLMIVGLNGGNLSVYKIDDDEMSLILTKLFDKEYVYFSSIDSNKKFIVLAFGFDLSILRKDNFVVEHTLKFDDYVLQVQVSSKYVVIGTRARMFVLSTADWKTVITERKLDYNDYNRHFAMVLTDNVLTVVDGKAVKQFKMSSAGCAELVTVYIDKDDWLHCITPDSICADEFWVGNIKGFLIKVNLKKRKVMAKMKCKWGMVRQVKCLQEFLLCGLFVNDSHSVVLAYEMKDLVGLHNIEEPSFRQVVAVRSDNYDLSNIETYLDVGIVVCHRDVITPITIYQLRRTKKTTEMIEE